MAFALNGPARCGPKLVAEAHETANACAERGARAQEILLLLGTRADPRRRADAAKASSSGRDRDRYGHTLGHAYLDGRYVNREMIAHGWAWHYESYWPDQEFAEAERDARAASRGLWADERPVAPWDFRRNPQAYLSGARANGRPAGEGMSPAAEEPIVYVTRTGEVPRRRLPPPAEERCADEAERRSGAILGLQHVRGRRFSQPVSVGAKCRGGNK